MRSYRLFKNGLPLKEAIRDRITLLSYYHRGTLRKKISKKYIAIPISKYVRLRNIPLKQFILKHKVKNAYLISLTQLSINFKNYLGNILYNYLHQIEKEWLIRPSKYIANKIKNKSIYYAYRAKRFF
jgi:hypothetical protein